MLCKGWVTEELPFPMAKGKAKDGFQPPLDEIDGAAYAAPFTFLLRGGAECMVLISGCCYGRRVLDPIYTAFIHGVYEFGKFYKGN